MTQDARHGGVAIGANVQNELPARELDLADARTDVLLVDRFLDADGHRFHVATGESAVGVQAFVDDEVA